MLGIIKIFSPLLGLINSITRNEQANQMIKDSQNSQDLIIKLVSKAVEYANTDTAKK